MVPGVPAYVGIWTQTLSEEERFNFQYAGCRCIGSILLIFKIRNVDVGVRFYPFSDMWNVDVGATKYLFSPMSNVDVAHGLESLV